LRSKLTSNCIWPPIRSLRRRSRPAIFLASSLRADPTWRLFRAGFEYADSLMAANVGHFRPTSPGGVNEPTA
jgi:hypothetical protein